MADADEEEEPALQQEQEPSDSADADADTGVQSGATDSPSPEAAPPSEAEAPAEPDGSPAAEAMHVNASVDQNNAAEGQDDAQGLTGSPAEDSSSGQDSAGDEPNSADQDSAPASNTEQPDHEKGHMEDGASLTQTQEADTADEPDSCSGAVTAPQPEANANDEPDSPGTPEAPPPATPPAEEPPPASSPEVAPPAEAPATAGIAEDPGPNQDQAETAAEPQTIAASPGSQPGDRSPAAGTASPGGHAAKPVRGTLARPNRGFNGVFVTRNGRKLTPEELVQSVERLSKADLFGVDMKELLAMYANAPKAKPVVGKAQISPDEIESMVERLYTTKPKHGMTYKARPTPMKAIFYIENGAHLSRLEPIPPKPAQERTEFMCSLYERCKESKAKSQQALADKYLQPLCKPKVYSGPEGKAKITEIAQKLFAGESTK